MIVVVKMQSANRTFKKCMVRDRVFAEVDETNKKIPNGILKTTDIASVIWIGKDGVPTPMPPNDYLNEMHDNMFYNSN
jgi:hypothetical protein